MTASLDSLFFLLALIFVLFHKRILRRLGLNPKRARDLFGILYAGVLILIVNYLRVEFFLSDHVRLFLAGLIVGIPAGILTTKDMFKNIKNNVLYPRRGFVFYLSCFVGTVLGGGAAYLGLFREFLSFAAGWSMMSLALLIFYVVRYEKRFGPLMLNRA
jgi:hypothetical protein